MPYQLLILFAVIALYFLYRMYYVGQLKPGPNADTLGTGSVSDNIYHQLLINASACTFNHDGILLCFEKLHREKLIKENNIPVIFSVESQYNMFDIDLFALDSKSLKHAKRLVKSTLDDPKPIVLTHWIETGEKKFRVGYNAYEKVSGDYNIPGDTEVEFGKITKMIAAQMATGNFTHLIVACTGWNNYQDMSIETYHKWLSYTRNAANEDSMGDRFRPFFIGLTWPSRWPLPLASFFNKANDADELGMTHICALLWKYLIPALRSDGIPVITIGHSFGARVMSRANHSRFMHKGWDMSTQVDLAIEFQGAYPITRFCEKTGSNGGLYTADVPIKKHVMTCSKFDHAIKQAFHSKGYIGNNKSIRKLKRNTTALESFAFGEVDNNGMPIDLTAQKSKILLDAKSIIYEKSSFLVGAHGDVRNRETGRLMWEFIKQIT